MTVPPRPTNRTLELDESQMRELGYAVIDSIVEHYRDLSSKPTAQVASRRTLDQKLAQPIPTAGSNPLEVVNFVREEVLSQMMLTNHPRFFAFVPGPSNFVAVMADALASGYNACVAQWMEASGPAAVELQTIDWLRQLCGLPDKAGGLFVSGGSVANLTALAVAREVKLNNDRQDAVVYCSEQIHASNRKALKVLGFSPEQLQPVPVDAQWRIDVDALNDLVRAHRASGRRPFCVIANGGTTNTGTVDPIEALVEVGKREDLWIHVDGAYGGAAVLCERGKQALRGLHAVDSLAIDPHKWLFQPFEIGCVLIRDFQELRRTFTVEHVYLQDVETSAHTGEVNLCDAGVQLSRGFRALKLWMSIKTFGLDAFRSAIDYTFDLAEEAEQQLRSRENVEVCTPATMGVVTFRFTYTGASEQQLNDLNLALVQAMIKDGYAMLSSTRLGEKAVLRLCTINPRTTAEDISSTFDLLEQFRVSMLK